MTEWVYVSLGDSWSQDDYTGIEDGGSASLLFRNHPMWPDFDGKDISSTFPNAIHTDLSNDGALFADILRHQIPQLTGPEPQLITMTMGNHELLRGLEQYAPGFVERDRLDSLADDCVDRYGQVLAALRQAVAQTPVFVNNIIDPSDGKNKVDAWVTWPQWGRFLDRLNERIADVIAQYDAQLIDVRTGFQGHGAVANASTTWLVNVTELNARGADGLRRLWWQNLEALQLV